MNVVIIVVLLILVIGIGALLLQALRWAGKPDLAAIDLDQPGRLVVRPLGPMRWIGFHGPVDVPLSSVERAEAAARMGAPVGFRLLGTGIPGQMYAGRFRSHGEQRFFLVGKAKQVLVLTLEDQPFSQVVVQVADPGSAADAVQAAVGRR
jgi:hypothetical protein